MTPCFLSPMRTRRILLLWSLLLTLILLVGIKGTPRHVTNGVPNKLTVGGGTPRRVHSRPKAAMARGCARKIEGSFHTLVNNSSKSSGVGAPFRGLSFWPAGTLFNSP